MRIKDLFEINKAITTSREFFDDNKGIPCVHYGDIYRFYNEKTILSSNILNKFTLNLDKLKPINQDSIIMPDVTETITDFGHLTYLKYDKTQYINGTHTLAILNNRNNNLKYLFYYLQSSKIKKQLQTLLLGSTVFQISKKDLENFELQSIHNESKQRHIVDIIGSIDDKIENNNKIIDKLDQLLILKFKNLKIVNSDLQFKDIFNVQNGFAFKSKEYLKYGDYKIITIKNVKNIGFSTIGCDYVEYNPNYKKYKLNVGDVLLTMTGEVGRVGIVDEINCLLNQRVLKVYNHSNSYTYAYLKSNYNTISSISKGSVQQNLSTTDLNCLSIYHSINDIIDFKKYDLLFDKILKLKQENIKLNKLKQLYLAKFF
jgi:hsdS